LALPKVVVSTVEIPVADLPRAIAWYDKVLGFKAGWADAANAILSRQGESVRLLLVRTARPERLVIHPEGTAVVHGVLDLQTDDLAALHAHLVGAGANPDPLGPPAHEWAPRGFGFWDSEGNRLGAFSYPQRT